MRHQNTPAAAQPAVASKKPGRPAKDARGEVAVPEVMEFSSEVGGLALLIGDGTYLNGKPFKYYS